jgi:hypothetical protein
LLLPVTLQDGGSAPKVFDFDDQVVRLVKWQPSSHGLTAMYSALVASRIAQILDAPAVRGCVVWVSASLVPADVHVAQSFHVGFTYLLGSNFQPSDYASIKNRSALAAAAVHLAWLAIGDQQGHNQYLWNTERILPDGTTRKMNHFFLVDQDAVFGRHDWSTGLASVDEAYVLPTHLRDEVQWKDVEVVIQDVEAISDDELHACFLDYPSDWLIDEQLARAGAQHLAQRRAHLRDVLRANWP